MSHIIVGSLQPQVEQLVRENHRLKIQVQTAEEMAHDYKKKYIANEVKIKEIQNLISQYQFKEPPIL